jgi:hypothetical protein
MKANKPSMNLAPSSQRTRWSALLITSILLLIWAVGLQDAIVGGLIPGYVSHPFDRPYPVRAVVMTCGIISTESALLFALLRPFSISRRRVFTALAVFATLWFADLMLVSGWSDQAGYCYSNGFFLLLTVGLLIFASAVSIFLFRKQSPTKTNDAA